MAFLQIPVNFYRTQAEALDTTDVHTTYADLTSYVATSPYMYSGQICSVINDGVYFVNSNKTVTKLSTGVSQAKQYLTEYYGDSAVFVGSALQGTLVTTPSWTIKKSVYSPTGTFISSNSAVNIAWSNRHTL